MAVGVYARISKDDDERALGVARQVADAEAIAEVRRWVVQKAYVDNDYSAFQTRVRRPAFEQLLADLQSGVLEGLVVYDLDRLARQPADLERLLGIFDSRPALCFATVQGDIDLMSPDGRTMARVLIAFANKSSMDTSRRTKRKHLELAQAGRPVGGTRPFGWQRDKLTLEPAEAEAIRLASTSVLKGTGLHAIAASWTDQGLTTPRGNRWEKTALKRVLLSPRLAGWRVHRGRIAVDAAGAQVRGTWEPILADTAWEALVAALNDPMRTGDPRNHVAARRYLLSGIMKCGACATSMYGAWNKKNGKHNYLCPIPTSSRNGCGKVSIVGPPTENLITNLILHRMSEEGILPELEPWQGGDELAACQARRSSLMSAFASGSLPAEAAFPAAESLSARINELVAQRADYRKAEFKVDQAPSDFAAAWQSWSLPERRAQIKDLISDVVVRPALRKGAAFTPDRLSVVWAD